MKSVKMMSALAAATLSLATTACEMPVEDEDVLLEQEPAVQPATGSNPQGTTCDAQLRGEGYRVNKHGVALSWFDDCLGLDMRLQVVLPTERALFDDSVQTAYGELYSPSGPAWAVQATFTEQAQDLYLVQVDILDGGIGGGSIRGEIAVDTDYVAIDGAVAWD